MQKTRCPWLPDGKPVYQDYHDTEWGVPVRNDQKLFEMLCLEGAQAGLSWETVLNKRVGYREAFFNFDIQKCVGLTDAYLEQQLQNPDIIRNRLKVFGVRKNAIAFLAVQKEFGSFSAYLWSFVNDEQILNKPKTLEDVPVKTELSDRIAKDLKKRSFTFVGSTIIYAYLQAVGVVNDHTVDCFKTQD